MTTIMMFLAVHEINLNLFITLLLDSVSSVLDPSSPARELTDQTNTRKRKASEDDAGTSEKPSKISCSVEERSQQPMGLTAGGTVSRTKLGFNQNFTVAMNQV